MLVCSFGWPAWRVGSAGNDEPRRLHFETMAAPSEYAEDELAVFAQTENVIAKNARKMIYDLNDVWKTIGVDELTRRTRTEDLIAFVQERYDEVVEETVVKMKSILDEIKELREEFTEMTCCLKSEFKTKYDDEKTLLSKKLVLEKDLDVLREEYKFRTDKINKLNEWHRKLYNSLGIHRKPLTFTPLPSEDAVIDFAHFLEKQQAEYENRVQIFVIKQRSIRSVLDELEMTPNDSFQRYIIDSCSKDFNVTAANMSQLEVVYENLTEQLEKRKTEILKMREHLKSLWERLLEPPGYCDSFLSKYTGHSRATENAILEEINRCEEKKRENFKSFIGRLRDEIKEMWDICRYSELQRQRFVEFLYNQDYNEDILERHEEYLEKLKEFYNENKVIFDYYEKRQDLWLKWTELEKKANEPGRFHNRGGQLLREEKERKAVSNQLPKIEKELIKLAEEYEERISKPFTIDGFDIIQIIKEDWKKKDIEKQCKLSARKQQLQPKTPMSVPRSAPGPHRMLSVINKDTLTAVKRRLSPRNSPHLLKHASVVSRKLHFTPTISADKTRNNPEKTTIPVLAINGSIIKKKKVVGRRSKELKGKRNSSKGNKASIENKLDKPEISVTYSDFQERINNDENCRSSVIPERTLRPRILNVEKNHEAKENTSPPYSNNFCTPIKRKLKDNTPNVKSNTRLKNNISHFATPRPVSKCDKATSFHRQNSDLVSLPTQVRSLRRSNSSFNIKSDCSAPYQHSPNIQVTSKFRFQF